jgi:hypothetical protein
MRTDIKIAGMLLTNFDLIKDSPFSALIFLNSSFRPFTCRVCNKQYYRQNLLIAHISKKHPRPPWEDISLEAEQTSARDVDNSRSSLVY